MFSLYINDLPSLVQHSDINLYADDTKLHSAHSDLYELTSNVQYDIDQIDNWMSANRLKIKFIKICDYIVETTQKLKDKSWTIYSNGICLKAVNCDKYLGVFIDCHLKWEEHILHVLC